ncbi:hypothetical protein RGU12_01720 [Fredinandcohnia sp. QZ13]|uniref:hypothetical protein n=1 Tax=Fredinandcohnia sp. QZ13 TaxID=3073144 RepID=UPI002853661E|nr:hypothetical protein [Fredinandcohnia sp. QZ13]MDR4886263.1 hypothetical protein [Fredinandcohnia sp. QZ13]
MGGSPFAEFYRERDERIERETLHLIVKVLDMLKEEKEITVISKETGQNIEYIRRIAKMLPKKERVVQVRNDLKLKEEGQLVDYNLYSNYSPVQMEVYDGKFFVTDSERENLLKLLIYNVGINRTLQIIEEYKEK